MPTTWTASRRSAPSGALIQRFGEGELTGGGAVAVDGAHGQVFVLEPAQGRVAVFEVEGAAAPADRQRVRAERAAEIRAMCMRRSTRMALETDYNFQYGTASCLREPAPCSEPAPPGEDRGRLSATRS